MTEVDLDLLVTALQREGVEKPHTILATTAHWLDDEARHAAARRIDVLTDDVHTAAKILARPTAECYGWVSTPESSQAILAATRGNEAVLATRTGNVVRLEPTDPDALIDAVVAQLPNTPPADGRSLNIPAADLQPSQGVLDEQPSSDVRMLRTLMARPRNASGQLHVAARDRLNRRRRSPNPLSYLDVREGRWMTRATADGWVHATPATVQLIVSTLGRMRRQLG